MKLCKDVHNTCSGFVLVYAIVMLTETAIIIIILMLCPDKRIIDHRKVALQYLSFMVQHILYHLSVMLHAPFYHLLTPVGIGLTMTTDFYTCY